jgi:hypothetical protein
MLEVRSLLRRSRHSCKNNIKMGLMSNKMGECGQDLFQLEDGPVMGSNERSNEPSGSIKYGLSTYHLLKNELINTYIAMQNYTE